MKRIEFTTLKLICLLTFAGLANFSVFSQTSQMREVENNSQAGKQAPAECLAAFRELFAYLLKPKTDIVTDKKSQDHLLTKLMRRDFGEYVKSAGRPDENPDYPSNSTFLGVWNQPTTYAIVGSRHYDLQNKDNPNDNRAVVDVLYEWDKKGSESNQYAGERSLCSYVFVFEDGTWKLDDLYTFDDQFASAESLRAFFSKE